MIPFKKLNLGKEEIEAVTEVIKSGQIGLGKLVYQFEKELAEYTGFKHAVVVDSCTSALFLSFKYWVKSEVTIPSMTVPLVADALSEAGVQFKFDTRVTWVGSAYKIEGSNIWDSAHELERDYRGKFGLNDVVCISFYPTKSIGSADGGAILTDDETFANWARKIATYGRDQGTVVKNSWEYDVIMKGYKRHYTNLQASICLCQLHKLDKMNKNRTKIRDKYNKAFGLQNESLYLYRISVDNRDAFIEYMKSKGIECGVHFKPLHLMSAFQGIPFSEPNSNETQNIMCRSVEEYYEHTVSLPFWDRMKDEDIEYVIEAVKSYEQK